jgi:hypothetical protein
MFTHDGALLRLLLLRRCWAVSCHSSQLSAATVVLAPSIELIAVGP